MLIPILVLAQTLAGAQAAQGPATFDGRQRQLRVRPPRIESEVTIDGRLDEPEWRQAARLTGFSQFAPVDGRPADDSTEVLVWYSPTAIHFGIRAWEPHGAVRAALSERDRIGADDRVELLLGTFDDGRQATVIGVNPLGVQLDGTLLESNQRGRTGSFGTEAARESADLSPDFVFQSRGHVTDWGYEVEVRVPFKSLRYQASPVQTWGINAVRYVQHRGAQDSWAPARRDDASFLGQSGALVDLTDLRRGLVLDLNPVVTQRSTGAPTGTGAWARRRERAEVGGDARWGITNDLTLNATVNPDFSQVESDEGQFAFDPRQALFVAEKRPFFLEGNELLATPSNLVYTRRITRPEAATKLTGRVAGLTVAFLGAVDDRATASPVAPTPADAASSANPVYTILRVQQVVRGRRLGVTYTGRERGGYFNRVADVDGSVVFRGLYTASAQLAASRTQLRTARGDTTLVAPLWAASLGRSGRRFGFRYAVSGIDPDFRTQSGFISRGNVANANIEHRFTRPGRPGALVETISFDPAVRWTWLYDRFERHADAIEKKLHLNSNFTLRGGWTGGASVLLETFGMDPDIYRGYRILRAEGDTIAFTGTPRLYNRDYLATLATPQWKRFSANAFYLLGQDENFEEWSSGDILWLTLGASWRPTEQLRVNGTYNRTRVNRASDGSRVYVSTIPRLKLEYQLTRAVFVRAVGEYDRFDRSALRDAGRTDLPLVVGGQRAWSVADARFRGDLLFSYQPNPGTVFFAGYGSSHAGSETGDPRLPRTRAGDLARESEALFVKASYLLRM